jgi:ketosteroid isomerase-like protein
MPTTNDVVNQHLKCFGENDLDGVLADYSSDAVLFIPSGPLRGLAVIRPFFQALISEFSKPGATFSMRQQYADGNYAYILWSAETADNTYEAATDTFVVQDGKIVAQSFAAKIIPKVLKSLANHNLASASVE